MQDIRITDVRVQAGDSAFLTDNGRTSILYLVEQTAKNGQLRNLSVSLSKNFDFACEAGF